MNYARLNTFSTSAITIVGLLFSVSANANTKIYGELNLSFDVLSADASADRNSLATNSSLLGVKGIKPFSETLSFIYKAEWAVNSDDTRQKSLIEKHNQVIGLAGKQGALILGRHDTPMKIVGKKADLFWHSQLGQNRNISNPDNWDLRPKNTLVYQTPRKKGLQASLAYAKDADTADNKDDLSLLSGNAFYKTGAYRFGVGFENHDFDGKESESAIRVMASYRMPKYKFVGFYQNEDNGAASDADVLGIGAAYAIGSGLLKGQYYHRNVKTGENADLFAFGYDRRIAKKTDVYAQVVTLDGGITLGGAGHGEAITPASGGGARGVSLGVRYRF